MAYKPAMPAEEKIRIVEQYLSGELGITGFTKKYGMHFSTLLEWVRIYKAEGKAGLYPAQENRQYSEETKIRAAQDYLDGKGSISDICALYGVRSTSVVRRWLKWYNSRNACQQPQRGGATCMEKGRKTTLEERVDIVSFCISHNKNYQKTSELHGVSYQQIYGWVRKYEEKGADGLVDRRGKRRGEGSMSELEKLRAQLKFKEAENLRLQMENELLKKWEALERRWDAD